MQLHVPVRGRGREREQSGMNRYQRLERELEGTGGITGHDIQALASLPAETVDVIVTALRATRRAGREDEKRARANRRRGRVRDTSEVVGAIQRQFDGWVRRAALDLETAALLHAHCHRAQEILGTVVPSLRQRGYKDVEIGSALGMSKQLMQKKFGPRSKSQVYPEALDDGHATSGSTAGSGCA